MSEVVVDFRTKQVADDVKIWALHAGRGKQFYSRFWEDGIVFLDLPRFEISREEISIQTVLRQQVRRALSWKDYLLKADPQPGRSPPSSNYKSYDGRAGDPFLNTQVTNVRRLYGDAKPGDVILVPGPHGQYGEILIGEITSDYDPKLRTSARAKLDYPVVYRTVKWLSVRPQRRSVSAELARRLENPHSIIEINREIFGKEVYSLAYTGFYSREISKTEIAGPKYASNDARDILQAADLISFFIAYYAAFTDGKASDLAILGIDDIVHRYYDEDLVDDLQIIFQSPGRFTVFTRRAGLALFLGGAIGLLVALGASGVVGRATALTVTNDGDPPSTQAEQQAASVLNNLISSMTPQSHGELLERARVASKKIGIKTGASVKLNQPVKDDK